MTVTEELEGGLPIKIPTPEDVYRRLDEARQGDFLRANDIEYLTRAIWYYSSDSVHDEEIPIIVCDALDEIHEKLGVYA